MMLPKINSRKLNLLPTVRGLRSFVPGRASFACGLSTLLLATLCLAATEGFGQIDPSWEKPLVVCWEIESEGKDMKIFASDNASENDSLNSNLSSNSNSATRSNRNRKTSFAQSEFAPAELKTQIFAFVTDSVTEETDLKELNVVDGRQIWTTSLGGSVSGGALTDRKNIYAIVRSGRKSSGPERSGDVKAETERERKTLFEERGYFVRALSRTTGLTDWQLKTDRKPLIALSPAGKYVYVIEDTGRVTYVESESGRKIEGLSFDFPARPDSLFERETFISANGKVLILIAGHKIFAARIEDDLIKNVREFPLGFTKNIITAVALDEDVVFLGDSLGRIYLFDTTRGEVVWTVKTGGRISGVSIYRDKVLIGSFDNYLYLYTKNSGRLDWKKRNAGRLAGLPPVFQKYAAVSVYGANASDLVDLETGKTVNRLVLGENRFFSGEARFLRDLLIFQTSDRIAAYSPTGCRN